MGWGTSLWMNWKQKKRRDRSHAKSSPFRELLQILFYGNSATVGSLLLGQNQAPEAVQAARTANAMKIPAYQADQTTIQNTFMTVVKEIKKEAGSDLVAAKAISKEATEKMFAELTKGQDMQNPTITPEAVVDAITGSISGVDGVNQEALDNFNKALLGLMQTMVLPEDDGQDN